LPSVIFAECLTLSKQALYRAQDFVECPIKSTRQSRRHSAKSRIPVVHVLVLWAFSCMSELVCLLDVDIVSYRENLNEFRQTISQTQVLITILIVPEECIKYYYYRLGRKKPLPHKSILFFKWEANILPRLHCWDYSLGTTLEQKQQKSVVSSPTTTWVRKP
jgi:hypothetical protein